MSSFCPLPFSSQLLLSVPFKPFSFAVSYVLWSSSYFTLLCLLPVLCPSLLNYCFQFLLSLSYLPFFLCPLVLPLFHLAVSSSCPLPFSSQLLLSVPFKLFSFTVLPMFLGPPVILSCCVFFLSFALLFSIIAFSSVESFSFTVFPMSFGPPVISPCCVFFLSFALLFSIIAFSSF